MSFWRFRNDLSEDPSAGDTVLDIEGELVVEDGWWTGPGTVSARDFRERLRGCGDVTVRINSPGGDVLAGAELYAALREHRDAGHKVTVQVTALAASAASVVAMAGSTVLMSPAAYLMIHNPWSMAAGNADDLRQLADQLDAVGEGIIEAYRLKTGKSRAKLKEMMDAETYMSAPTAIREGFADGLMYEARPTAIQPSETSMAAASVRERMVARLREMDPALPAAQPDTRDSAGSAADDHREEDPALPAALLPEEKTDVGGISRAIALAAAAAAEAVAG